MTHVQKLSIQGIRSFDPEDRQEINFYPLTIILGPNGAGKTTIIESLKYATTGNLPPNCNLGKSFLHDVQFANQAIIRGQIRLRFTDVEKKSTVITRSMQTSVKQQKGNKPTVTFKQMNSVIKREEKSIDQKCADINSEVIELIGVSRALLNNVIFCHQEETNWPLSEGKVLKEKFDDIFGSIGYVKVLEKIKKTREEEVKQFKLLEKDVNYFALLKKEADSKRRLFSEEKGRLDIEKGKVRDYEAKMKDVQVKLEDLIDKEAHSQETVNAISQIGASIAEKRKLAKDIERTCSASILCKNKDQVDEELVNFDENSKKMVLRKKDLEVKLRTLESDYTRLVKEKQKVASEEARIGEYSKQIAKLTTERNGLLQQIESNSPDFESVLSNVTGGTKLSSNDRAIVRKQLEERITQMKASANEKRSTVQKQESTLKSELDSMKSKKSNASHERAIWQKQLIKLEKDISELDRTMSRMSKPKELSFDDVWELVNSSYFSAESLSKLEAALLNLQSDQLNDGNMNDVTSLKQQLGENISKIKMLTSEIDQLKAEKEQFLLKADAGNCAEHNLAITELKRLNESLKTQLDSLKKDVKESSLINTVNSLPLIYSMNTNLNKKKELTQELRDLKQKIRDLEGKSQEFSPDIDRLEAELRTLTSELKKFEKDNQQSIYESQDLLKKFERLFSEIEKYSNELKQSQLKTSKEYIDKLVTDIEQLEEDRKTLSLQMTEASQGIANLELQKRELLDCQRYLIIREGINQQEEKLKLQRQKIGNMDFAAIKEARIKVENELTVMKTKSTIGKERIREIDVQIGKIAAELKSGGYEGAETKYREKLIEKTVCEIACDDLNKYYKALDFSISSFHKCKMEEINKLLKKFWEIAYQGKDIDHILIVSDEEERNASDKRRSYNYRVVMVKNGKEMDMKGRCSAGQKVLASLIIRLALAVIFCRNFAVLTLDEPTTNLDKANIHSFARAVISLIKSNRNFQIIIITHDDEFLQCLDADTGEFYYKVFKNDKGYSSIVRKSINTDTQIFIAPSKQQGDTKTAGGARKREGHADGEEEEEDAEGDIPMAIAPKRPRVDHNGLTR